MPTSWQRCRHFGARHLERAAHAALLARRPERAIVAFQKAADWYFAADDDRAGVHCAAAAATAAVEAAVVSRSHDAAEVLESITRFATLLLLTPFARESRPIFDAKLKALMATFGPDNFQTIEATFQLGTTLVKIGELDEGIELLTRALHNHLLAGSIEQRPSHASTRVQISINLAHALATTGRTQEALSLLHSALEFLLANPHINQSLEAPLQNIRAQVGLIQGDLPAALAASRRAASLLNDSHDVPPQHRLAVLSDHASVLWHADHKPQASAVLHAALLEARDNLHKDDPLHLKMQANAALFELYDRPEHAAREVRRILERLVDVLGDDHPDVAECTVNFTRALQEVGAFEDAAQIQSALITLWRQRCALATSKGLHLLGGYAVSLFFLDRFGDAIPIIEEWMELSETLRAQPASLIGRARQEHALRVTNLGVGLAACHARIGSGQDAIFTALERTFARSTLDAIADPSPRRDDSHHFTANPRSLAQTHSALRQGEVLLIYAANQTTILLAVIQGGPTGHAHTFELCEFNVEATKARQASCRTLLEFLNPVVQSPRPSVAQAVLIARDLRDLLFPPAVHALCDRARSIFVAANDWLQSVPFDAIAWLAGDAPLASKPLAYIPSASALVALRDRSKVAAPGSGILLVGDVNFDTPVAGPTQQSRTRFIGATSSLPKLPGSRREIDDLTSILSASESVHTLTGPAANPNEVRRASKGKRVVHLSTHAVHGGDEDPSAACLYLAGRDQPARLELADLLTSWRTVLDGCELVTLSACWTDCAHTLGGNSIALPLGFLHAGSRCVLATPLPSVDLAAWLLMRRFYQLLLTSADAATALVQAKRWLRDLAGDALRIELEARAADPAAPTPMREAWLAATNPRPFAHPMYWAGFRLIGDPPLSFNDAQHA